MVSMIRPVAVGLTLLMLVGCTTEQQQAVELCRENPAQCAQAEKGQGAGGENKVEEQEPEGDKKAGAEKLEPVDENKAGTGKKEPAVEQSGQMVPRELRRDKAPLKLQSWADFMRNREEAAIHIYQADDGIYLAVAGGQRNSGGYQVKLVGDATKSEEGAWQLRATVLPPTGMATAALTNPVDFFLLPGAEGQVEVSLEGAGEPLREALSVRTSWMEGNTLHVEGMALLFADLHFAAAADGKEAAAADAQVKEGHYVANLVIPEGPMALTLTVSAPAPGGYTILDEVSVRPAQ